MAKNFGLLNPQQCAEAIQDKQIVFNALFSKITEENLRNETFGEKSPQQIFGRFSRFTVSILGETSVSSNIKISQIAGIKARSNFAAAKHYESLFNPAAGDGNTDTGSAYTVKFIAGNMKGKSPAEILLEEGDTGLNNLREQWRYLEKNVAKYPNNRKLMDAITEAANLYKDGKLSGEQVNTLKTNVFDILPDVPKPNVHKTVMAGNVEMHPTHSLRISCRIGEKYPICIEIKNFNCPVKTTDTGGINALLSQMDKSSLQTASINLDMDTWLGIVADLERQIEVFSVVNGRDAFILADKLARENREAAQR